MGPLGPTYRLPGSLGPPVSPSFARRFSTALRIASTPFIQVGLIRGLRIDAPAYIYLPTPPLQSIYAFDSKSGKARNPNSCPLGSELAIKRRLVLNRI